METGTAQESTSDRWEQSCIVPCQNAVANTVNQVVQELTGAGRMTEAGYGRIIGNMHVLESALRAVITTKFTEWAAVTDHLRPTSSAPQKLRLGPTNGMETIDEARSVFPGGIDPKFQSELCNIELTQTPAEETEIRCLDKAGTLAEIFAGVTADLSTVCFTQHQVILFAQTLEMYLIRPIGETFFVIQAADGRFCVACIAFSYRGNAAMEITFHELSSDKRWNESRHRQFVLPIRARV